MSEREIFHGPNSMSLVGPLASLSADLIEGEYTIAVLLTMLDGGRDTEIALTLNDAARLGEWLLERANQAGEQ